MKQASRHTVRRAALAAAILPALAGTVVSADPLEYSYDLDELSFLDVRLTANEDVDGNLSNFAKSGINGSVRLEAEVPLILPIAVNGFFLDGRASRWGDPLVWNNPALVVGNSAAIANNIKGILQVRRPDGSLSDRTFSLRKTFKSLEILGSQGPTERPITVWEKGLDLGFPSGYGLADTPVDIGFKAGVGLKWDVTLPSGANTVLDQQATLELLTVESGAILSFLEGGNVLSGQSNLVTRQAFVNRGFITGLTGSSEGVFSNDGTILVRNGFTAVGSAGTDDTYEQKFFNTGELRVESGALRINGPGVNHGLLSIQGGSFSADDGFENRDTFELRSGSLGDRQQFLNSGTLSWHAGRLDSGFTNAGRMRIVDDGLKLVDRGGSFRNAAGGVVEHVSSESIQMIGGFRPDTNIFNDGLWKLMGEGGLTRTEKDLNANFQNAGTLRKEGPATAEIGPGVTLYNTGTVEVLGGVLRMEGGVRTIDANYTFGGGGRLEMAGFMSISGTQTGSGDGTLVLAGGTYRREGGDAVLDFRNGSHIEWQQGNMDAVTNAGLMRIIDGGLKQVGQGNVFTNAVGGVLEHFSDEPVQMIGGFRPDTTIVNDGLWVLRGEGGFTSNQSLNGNLRNSGTLRKEGPATVAIGAGVALYNAGTIEVLGGTLLVDDQASFLTTNGNYVFGDGGRLEVANGMSITGTQTGTGDGVLVLAGGGYRREEGDAILDFRNGSRIEWRQGSMDGVTNAGLMRIVDGGLKQVHRGASFTNAVGGVIEHVSDEPVQMFGGFRPDTNIFNSGLWVLQGEGGVTSNEFLNSNLRNSGTLRKTGAATATVGAGMQLINEGGKVEVLGGTLNIASYQQSGGELQLEGGQVAFGSRPNITGGLITGSGTITGDLLNTGGTISPGFSPGTLSFADDLTLGGGSTLLMEIAGDAAGEYDFIDVGGDLTLGGLLRVTLLDGFRPGEGERFALLGYGGTLAGTFDDIEVLGSDYQFAADYAADGSVFLRVTAVPEPGAALVFAGLAGLLLRRRRVAGA